MTNQSGEQTDDFPEDQPLEKVTKAADEAAASPGEGGEQPSEDSNAAPTSSLPATDPILTGNTAGGWYTPDEELEPPAPPPPAPQPFSQPASPPPVPSDTQPVRPSRMPPGSPQGATPRPARPRSDSQGIPLPRRVDEIDLNATRVTPSAYGTPVHRWDRPPTPAHPAVAQAAASA